MSVSVQLYMTGVSALIFLNYTAVRMKRFMTVRRLQEMRSRYKA